MNVVTKDGHVHKGSDGPEGATTQCGLTEQVYTAGDVLRVTCPDCATKTTCPKCGQRVGIEVLRGRIRVVTTTVVHIKPGPAAVVCHAVLKTEENR